MKLKAIIDKLEDVAEPLRELYTQQGDKFVLEGVEDTDFKTKLSEFRDNNIDLKKKLEELTASFKKFEDVDVDKYKEFVDLEKKNKDKQLLSEGKVEELIKERTTRMEKEYQDKLANLEKNANDNQAVANSYKARLDKVAVESAVNKTINNLGVLKKNSMFDVFSRAKNVWKVDEKGDLVAKGVEGQDLYSKDGKSKLSMEEWGESLLKEAPHLFEENRGGGAAGGQGGGGTGTTIAKGDHKAYSQNLEDIASGKIKVV